MLWLSGYPRLYKCIHDQGGKFIGEAFQAKLATWGIHDGGTTSKNATANAIFERMHLTVANILRTRYNNAAPNFQVAVEEIKRALAACNHAMRCAVSTALMNNTPGETEFHRDMLLNIPVIVNLLCMQQKRQYKINENLRRQNAKQKEFDYRIGGEVLIKNTDGKKLDPKYRGLYSITNFYTNGKSINAKASSAKTKKSGVSKMKTTSGAKKSVKKRVEIDLEQPKDRDPIDSKMVSETQTEEKRVTDDNEAQRMADEIEAKQIAEREARRSGHYNSIVPNLLEWWMQNLYSGDAVDEALERHDRIHTGNALFIAWEERFPAAWNQPCLRYDDPFNDNTGTATCEDRFARIFTSLNSDNSQLTKYLIAAFDTETMEVNPSEEIWSLRILAMRISLQNPFSFFGIDEFEGKPDDSHFFSGELTNPRLRLEHPLVGFWLICSELFDYPWINEFLLECYDDPPSAIVDAIKQTRSGKSINKAPNRESVKEPDPPCIQKIYDPVYSIDEPGTDVQRDSTSSKGDQAPESSDEDEDTDADDTDDREDIVDDAMEEDNDDERVNSAGANPHNVAMDDNTPPLTSPKLMATQDSAGTGTLMEASATTPSRVQRPPTLAKRISSLIQVNMEGIPGKCHIFETTFSVEYQGSDSGTVAEALLSTVLNSMEEAINNSPNELELLPISDTTYKQQNLWIRNSVDLHNRISTYRALSTYCDMEYGNCPYAATNSKPGEKKLRARLRVGFSAEASVKAVQDYLHTGLRQLGRGAGCYPSPLQYGEIVKIGSCSFIPAEVNFSAYAKELMRLFDFEVPIGIKMDWVSIPYTGRAKYDERSPGVTSPHCFTRRSHAKRVDRTLRSILHPATAKPDFPFAAPATYISDWKSAQQSLLSVKAYGPVKDAILTLIRYCQRQTPPTTADDDSSEEEDDESQEGAVSLSGAFTKVTKKKVKKKKTKKKSLLSDNLENHFLKDLSGAQRKLAEATDRKLQNDIDRHKAGPLFLMILPGEMEGSYIFVCRKKYGQLARNVLRGIVPFLIHHLCELTDMQADRVLGKWIPKSEIQATRRKWLVWSTNTLRAIEASDQSAKVEEALEFLDDVIEDTTDVYQGQLSIDMDMANAKDIDDGQTVTGMLDEMHEREQQLEDAFVEIEAPHHLAIDSQPPAQNNEVSPDRSEFTTPPKKRKSKDTSTTKRRVDRSKAGLKPPTKSTRTSTSVHFQQPKQRSWNTSQVQVDTTQMEGDTTIAVSQYESLSSLTAASPGGVHPFFLPSPSSKSGGDCLGDDHRCRSSLATSVTFQNVNGVPEEGDHVKQRQINSWLQDERVGIALLAEAKTFWPSIPEGPQRDIGGTIGCGEQRCRQSTEVFIRLSLIINGSHNLRQLQPFNGEDASRQCLVRSRTELKKQGAIRRGQTEKIDPRKALVDDLCKQIQKWRDEGCEVLLGIDANEDLSVNSPDSIRQRFRECGMEEAILKRHPPTATHQQNQSNVPIDGIFTTSGVPVLAGGYYAFGEFVEPDHRALWIDIDLNTALGNFTPQGSTFKPRKLTLLDKRSVRRYLQLAHLGYEEYDIPSRLTKLNQRIESNGRQMSPSLARKYNCLHRQMYMTTDELEEALAAERRAYKQAKRQATQLRRDFLTVQTKDAKQKKWKSQKAHDRFLWLRRMKQREEARRRRRAQQKGSTGGLRAMQIEEKLPDGTQQLRTISLTVLWLKKVVCKKMRHGRYSLPDLLDPATTAFLSHCRFHKDHLPVHLEVTTSDHVYFWSQNPEDKGSEPHGLHNGHFKAAAQSPVIASCDALFRNFPLATGFVPSNWQNLMNFAIEKKAGDFRLSKMRTIQLMNSEAQASNKKAGRAAMRYAEEHSLIPDGQCGSRKRHQAIDLALSKRLVWDLLILQQRAAGWISNDAKSCFDRIVHWVAIIAMLRFGLTWRVLSSMFNNNNN
ncbi:unnamed protein product [Cylindrotheca closterium]|uniref:Integrase catalytic domain-containing protein n=1 Tax=Cylindrotheca closterium TaxID=2856 RepID=A0AAD2CSZ2_9STRA|nr:unnamed protein product [Cylindrotheca closterium]